jgi:ABC-type transport system involved in multi-copper enzyme maturation permease subunit
VFAAECLTAARRWQFYAGRSLLIASVLAGLVIVRLTRFRDRSFTTIEEYAAVGAALVNAIMAVELVLAIVVVPAAAAGVVCQDKMRGGLTLMMVTDLSDAEIVLGKLASRLVTILGIVCCGLPVLAIMTSLGGVDPLGIVASSAVIVAVAVLGVSLALTFSVWATKPHEALMATYAVYAIWLLALLAWQETARGAGTPDLLYVTNPFWLLFGAHWSRGSVPFLECGAFLIGALAVSALLALVSTWRIRAVAIRQAGRPAHFSPSRRRLRISGFLGWSDATTLLEQDPILWRELHRLQPAGWGRALWKLYAALSAIFTLLAIFGNNHIAPGVAGFTVSIGLLMVSVTSSTVLAEERAHGSLDVLMTTPLSTRAIAIGKWRGAYRIIPWLAILPGALSLATAWMRDLGLMAIPWAALTASLVLAYGAVSTSVSLFTAAWQPKLGRAVGFSVAANLSATVIWPTIMLMTTRTGPDDVAFLWVSPFFGMYLPLSWTTWRNPGSYSGLAFAVLVWVGLTGVAAYVILRATVMSFDRLLGRMPETSDWSGDSARRRAGSRMGPERPKSSGAPAGGYGVRVTTTASSRTT